MRKQNHDKTEQQRAEGKVPGMYRARLLEKEQQIKSQEDRLEREKRREQRKNRQEIPHDIIEEAKAQDEKSYNAKSSHTTNQKLKNQTNSKLMERVAEKYTSSKPKGINHDLRF